MDIQTHEPKYQWLTYLDVCNRYRIGSSTLYRWIADKRFPAGVMMGRKSRRWNIDELVEWEKEQEGAAFYGSCGGAGEIRGGLPIDRYANPITTASILTIGVVNGGSDSIGACLMAQYRLAILSGTGANLCTYTIHSYRTITATSYKAARQIAAFEGALVIGWRVIK